jgi:uncharacterized surface protein with fasciclin (FAS1) repeats
VLTAWVFRVSAAAPSNAAISKLPPWVRAYFTDPAHAAYLKGLLEYHIAPSLVNVSNVYPNQDIPTIQGSNLFVEYLDGAWSLPAVCARF